MKIICLFALLLCAFTGFAQNNAHTTTPFCIGESKLFPSKVLNEDRTLNIYLPSKYNKEKSYPVIYLLDGSAHEDFLHIVGLVQFFNMQFQMPDFIVVGIANVDRKRDFTYHTDVKEFKEKYPTTGSSAKFIQFIETELQPFIQTTYNTNDTKYIIGQSLGGLLATEILLKKPSLFSHYLIVSPSLWWDNESLLKDFDKLRAQNPDTKPYIYISVGEKEHKIMQKDAKTLANLLLKSQKDKSNIHFAPLKDEDHATILHQSINEAFKKLFPVK